MMQTDNDASIARKRLHDFISNVEDSRAIHLYEFLKEEILHNNNNSDKNTIEFEAELNERWSDYEKGKSIFSKEEMDIHTSELLKTLRKAR